MRLALQGLVASQWGYQNVQVQKEDKVNKTSALGTPVWMDLNIPTFRYRKTDTAMAVVQGMNIPCVIIEASGTKTIVKTPIQGLHTRGTVKEYVNHGDIMINIKGVIANDKSNRYPKVEVENLMSIISAPVSFPVTHTFLNHILNVKNLVIESYSFPSKPGFQNIQLFELNCVSDEPIELISKVEKVK